MRITDYRLRKLDVPADRPIGDSQIDPIEDFEIAYLELETDAGPTGIGFGHVNFGGSGAVAVDALRRDFAPVGDALVGSAPGAALHRIERPRGNDNSGPGRFDTIVDVALWDLVGKHHDLPVYRLMGGTAADRRVPAYASGLAYARDDDEVRDLYREFAGMGFDAAKVKVGTRPSRPTSTASRWFGTRSTRRRSWPTRTRRSRRRRPSGGGAPTGTPGSTSTGSRIRSSGTTSPACVGWSARWTHLNAGEYRDTAGEGELLGADAVDTLNIHGLTPAYRSAVLANRHGVALSVGNTPASVGVHAAAALPEVSYIEYSRTGWHQLVDDPIRFENGEAIAPDRPGHGLEFADEAFEAYEAPDG